VFSSDLYSRRLRKEPPLWCTCSLVLSSCFRALRLRDKNIATTTAEIANAPIVAPTPMPAAAPVLRDERALAVEDVVEDVVEVACVTEVVELVGLADEVKGVEVLAATVCWSSACGAGAWNVSSVGSEHVIVVDPPQHAHKLLVVL
jgi:hypothetical protein